MGVPRAAHRLNAPAALALVLALAGSTSPTTHPGAVETVGSLAAATTVPAATQPNASVTVVAPQGVQGTGTDASGLQPAVRIAATGPSDGTSVQADIADVLLDAYRAAVAGAPVACHLQVSLLAAVGQVESGSLAGRPIDAEHRTSVLGPVLDGNGFAAIPDTDGGAWDGDTRWDRAVGPMQFIPGTWRSFGADGDGDGVAHPQDVEDAAAGAAAYLCYGARDLARPADLRSAILSYNHSTAYLRLVTTYQQRYAALGLDDGTSVTGLPTSISLIATPAGPGRWKAAELVARANAAAQKDRTAATTTQVARQKAASPSTAPSARPSATPSTRPSATPSASPSGSTSPSPSPSTSPTPSASPTGPTPGPGSDECVAPAPSASPAPATDGDLSPEQCDPCAPADPVDAGGDVPADTSSPCPASQLSPPPSPSPSPTSGP